MVIKKGKRMKARIVIIFFTSFLICLTIVPGCTSKEELNNCNVLIKEQEEQIGSLQIQVNNWQNQASSLNSTLQSKEVQIEELLKQQQEQEEQAQKSETAKIEISLSPNPVVCAEGDCCFETVIKEINGVGIEIEKLMYLCYNRIENFRFLHSKSDIESMFQLENAYLPAYNQARYKFCLTSSTRVDYIVVIIEGKDDNGNLVKVISDKLYFEGTAETPFFFKNSTP